MSWFGVDQVKANSCIRTGNIHNTPNTGLKLSSIAVGSQCCVRSCKLHRYIDIDSGAALFSSVVLFFIHWCLLVSIIFANFKILLILQQSPICLQFVVLLGEKTLGVSNFKDECMTVRRKRICGKIYF